MKQFYFKFLLSFFLSSFTLEAIANNINALKLWFTSGHDIIYKLDECPIVTFKNEELIITTPQNAISYKSNDVVKFTYTYIDPQSINDVSNETIFSLSGNVLNVKNLIPLSSITIYTVDGNVLVTTKTNEDGQATLQIPEAFGKVLIVKTSTINFKIIKQ